MAVGKKTGGRDFAPGNKLGGRHKTPEDLKTVKKLTRNTLELLINKYLNMDKNELTAVSKDWAVPVLDLMIVSIIYKAVVDGDQTRLDFILNRLIGRVKEQIEITIPKPTIIQRRDGSQVILGTEPIKIEESTP